MLVKEVMSKNPITIEPDKTVFEACDIYKQHKVGCLIVTKDERCLGMITERDIIERTICKSKDPKTTPVSEIMTPEIKTIHALDSLDKAIKTMQENNIKKLPVIKDEIIIGILTVTDITKARPDLSKRFIDTWIKTRWSD